MCCDNDHHYTITAKVVTKEGKVGACFGRDYARCPVCGVRPYEVGNLEKVA